MENSSLLRTQDNFHEDLDFIDLDETLPFVSLNTQPSEDSQHSRNVQEGVGAPEHLTNYASAATHESQQEGLGTPENLTNDASVATHESQQDIKLYLVEFSPFF